MTQAEYIQTLRAALNDCLSAIPFCEHEYTHRGGAIWTICDNCGTKWADDEGGPPQEVTMPKVMQKALAVLSAPIPDA